MSEFCHSHYQQDRAGVDGDTELNEDAEKQWVIKKYYLVRMSFVLFQTPSNAKQKPL